MLEHQLAEFPPTKAVILRNVTWSLAVEWNQNYRVIALGGAKEAARAFVATLPKLKINSISETTDGYLRVRTEQALDNYDDTLFETEAD
jgi:hypothetical protein